MDQFFQQGKFSAPIFRFEGIPGNRLKNPRPKNHHLGHNGALLSHMSLWYHISQKSSGSYFVMEDDLGFFNEDNPPQFEQDLNKTLADLPSSVQMLHCTLDKSVKFKYEKSRFENSYKVVGNFNGRPIKKCSLVYPWASLAGAYLLTPRTAGLLFRFAHFSISNAWWLPLKPKRYNIDLLMSRSVIASIYGAMSLMVEQNLEVESIGGGHSDIHSAPDQERKKDILVNKAFFQNAHKSITNW